MLTLPPFPCRAGGVCALISNNRLSQAVKSTFPSMNNTLDDVQTYVTSIPQVCMVPLPCLRGKGPGRRSSSTGEGQRRGWQQRKVPTFTDTTSLSLQQIDFIIKESNVPLDYANRSLQGEGVRWKGLEHPLGPVASCSRAGGS